MPIWDFLTSIDWLRFLGQTVPTLVAAMAGAYFAFRLERVHQESKERNAQVAEGNLALFTLTQMWNVLKQYQLDVVEDWRDREDAWLNMPVTLPDEAAELKFNLSKLGFLIYSSNPNILNDIALHQRRFQFGLTQIKSRNEMHLTKVFPRMDAAGIRRGVAVPTDAIENTLGGTLVHQMKSLSAGIIENIDDDVRDMQRDFGRLRDILCAQFSGKKFINYVFEDESNRARRDGA